MSRGLVIIIGFILFSCGDDAAQLSKAGKKSVKDKIIYSRSSISLDTERDSISYILGFEMAKPFITDTVFSLLDKEEILAGFQDSLGSTRLDSCEMKIQSFLSSEDLRKNKTFIKECATCVGALNRMEFYSNFDGLNALDLVNFDLTYSGLKDGFDLKNAFLDDTNSVNILFSTLKTEIGKRYNSTLEQFQREGNEFLENNKKKKGVKQTPSGLQYKVLRKGTGKNPTAGSKVKVNYKGTLLSGETFDSSYDRGAPIDFQLNQVIPGWTEGIQLMKKGSKFEFFIPHELAYGANPDPRSGIKPYSLLIFEVELLEISTP